VDAKNDIPRLQDYARQLRALASEATQDVRCREDDDFAFMALLFLSKQLDHLDVVLILDTPGYAGPDTGGAFEARWLDAESGAIVALDRMGDFDAAVVAEFYWEHGVAFEYVPVGWFEGMMMTHKKRQRGTQRDD
jgi:hypothetical protein